MPSAPERASLRELLDYAQASQQTNYLLIDPATQPDFWPEWRSRMEQNASDWAYLYKGTAFGHWLELSPLIVTLQEGNIGDQLLQAVQGERWGCHFISPFSLQTLREHAFSVMQAQFPTGQQALFRWFSPTILHVLLNSDFVSAEEKLRLLHPVSAVYLRDAVGSFQRHVRNDNPVAPQMVEVWSVPADFLAELESRDEGQALSRLALELFKAEPSLCMGLSHRQITAALAEGIELARKLEPGPFVTRLHQRFALARFLIASDFYRYPDFRLAIKLGSLASAMQTLSRSPRWKAEMREHHHNPDWLTPGAGPGQKECLS